MHARSIFLTEFYTQAQDSKDRREEEWRNFDRQAALTELNTTFTSGGL